MAGLRRLLARVMARIPGSCAISLLLIAAWAQPSIGADDARRRVLILSSYNYSFPSGNAAADGARWAISPWTAVLPISRCSRSTSALARGIEGSIARWPVDGPPRVVLATRATLTDVLGRVRVGPDRDCRMAPH